VLTDAVRVSAAPIPPGPSSPAGEWALADSVMLRINPTAGRRLSTVQLRTALGALYAAERRCAELAEPACDALFALAATVTGKDRHRLLHLKRAVYNGRDPGPGPWPTDLPPVVAAWVDANERRMLARTAVETGHPVFLAQEREAFADALGSEPFLLSLALNSPHVLDAVARYRHSAGRPSARDRKSERGLIQHYARAILRVSPLSRLTAAGFAQWSPQGIRMDRARFDRRQAHSLLSVDQPLLSALVNGILQPPENVSSGASPAPEVLTRNAGLKIEDEQVRFYHRVGGQARMLGALLTEGLAVLLRLTELGPIGRELLVTQAAERLGISEPEARELVATAAGAQILVAGPLLDEQSPHLLATAQKALAAEHPEAGALLGQIGDALDLAARGSVTERAAALNRVQTAERGLNALSGAPARLRVNEDYLLPPRTVSRAGYEQALTDLSAVARFSAMYDRHHDTRALLTRLFVERFGVGGQAPLLDHAAELVAVVRGRQAVLSPDNAAAYGPADGSLGALLNARTAADAALGGLLTDGAGQEEVDCGAAWLAGLAADLPDRFTAGGSSYGLLVQPSGEAAGRLVINACYPGLGQLTTRFLGHLDPDGASLGRLRRRLHDLHGGQGTELVEDHDLHGSNLNHRPRVLERTMTARDWTLARLVHDPATDRVCLVDAEGAPIRVFSLGMKWIDAQPAPLLLAVWLHGPSLVAVDPVERVHATRPGWSAATGETVRYPRLVAGRCVLQRRRWYPGRDLPAPTEPTDEVADLLALTAWRARHDVPEQIVVKTPLWRMPHLGREDEGPAAAARIQQIVAARRREKPQYVDLSSALMVRVLPMLMQRRRMGYFEEALPGVRNGAHAAEWALELDRLPRGTAGAGAAGTAGAAV